MVNHAKWVAMAKRLPPDVGFYIIYAPSADPKSPMIASVWWDDDGWGLVPAWKNAVTHWMPLPKPPTKGRKAK